MPTEKPRISVVLEDEQAELLRRLSVLLEQSVSQTVGEVLKVCAPVFEQMVEVLEAKKRAEEQERLRELAVNRDLVLLGQSAAKVSKRMRHRKVAQWRDFVRITRALLKTMEVTAEGAARGRKRSSAARHAEGGTPEEQPALPWDA
jgi:hypothetical protein